MSFRVGDMVQIAGRKSGRGRIIRAARMGVVIKPYKATGATGWITRVKVLVNGEVEDINVSWLSQLDEKKIDDGTDS